MFRDGDNILIAILHQGERDWMQHEFRTSLAAAEAVVRQYDSQPDVAGIYITAQQLKPEARSNGIADAQAYVRFIVDVDRKNKKVPVLDASKNPVIGKNGKPKMRSTNATEEEREELLAAVKEIVPWVSGILEAKPMVCDSGNGFHLLWFLTRPCKVDVETQRTVKEGILTIKQKFEKGNVDIDDSVADPGQLIRLWGTWNRKAEQEEGRPWRQSRILRDAVGKVIPASLDLLALQYSGPKVSAMPESGERLVSLVMPEWLSEFGVEDWCDWAGEYAAYEGSYEKGGATHYKLGNCVWDTADGLHEHQDGVNQRQTELILFPDGGVKLNCLGSDDWFQCNREQFAYRDAEGVRRLPEVPSFRMLVDRVNQLKDEDYPRAIFRPSVAQTLDLLGSLGIDLKELDWTYRARSEDDVEIYSHDGQQWFDRNGVLYE